MPFKVVASCSNKLLNIISLSLKKNYLFNVTRALNVFIIKEIENFETDVNRRL